MQALYIEGKTGCRVSWDEPALRLEIPEQSDRLFPLARLSRIVSADTVEWSMPSLLACADAGVPLVFMTQNGDVRLRCWGQPAPRQSLTQRLLDLLSRSDGKDQYQDWYNSVEKMAVRSFCRRMHVPSWREVPVNLVNEQLAKTLFTDGQYAVKVIQSLLESELKVLQSTCELSVDDDVLLTGNLNILQDLSRLLLWDYYPLLFRLHTNVSKPNLHTLVQLFEQRTERLHRLFSNTLYKLQHFLAEID
jgi:hypothetical protein